MRKVSEERKEVLSIGSGIGRNAAPMASAWAGVRERVEFRRCDDP